ncbi:hypothetical protein GHK03_06510 [Sinorhizobium medicae]|nr:hypothetical protein [Sinorhizobium medicae]
MRDGGRRYATSADSRIAANTGDGRLMAITVFEDCAKAYADSRDVGHKKGDKR